VPVKILGVKRTKGGVILCEHGITKYACRICSPAYFCEHGVSKRQCVPCKGAAVCKHSRLKYNCRECHGGAICRHDKFRSKCADCTPKGVYVSYRNGAKKRGIKFPLTLKDYLKISDSPCFYCGDQKVRNGVDRKNNSVGYTSENSAPCCSKCNLMKRDYSIREFLIHIRKINKYRRLK
jgi:hypothetical protein